MNLPFSVIVFLYLGLIREYKGLEQLLEASADIEAENVCWILADRARQEAIHKLLVAQSVLSYRVEISDSMARKGVDD